jgi:ABC-2 type transport system permease protein
VTRPVGPARAASLLIRLRVRRLLNQVVSIARYRIGSPDRKAASSTSPVAWVLSALVGLAMLGSFTSLAYQAVNNVETTLGTVRVSDTARGPGAGKRDASPERRGSRPLRRLVPPAPGSVLAPGVIQGLVFGATLLLVAALMMTLAGRELARPEWDLEWLATLPVPLFTLVLSRLIERAVTNTAGFLALAPFLSVLAWTCGYRWTAPLLGLALTSGMLFIIAAAQGVLDTTLRLSVSPPKVRNLQAALSVLAVLPTFLAMSIAMPVGSSILGWASAMPAALAWLPAGLAVRVLAAADGGSAALRAAIFVAEIVVLLALGLALLRWLIRLGVAASGAREAVARAHHAPPRAVVTLRAGPPTLLSTIQRRELRLLGRDRTFMVQTLVLPVLIVGTQVLFAGSNIFAGAVDKPLYLAAIAFGLVSYTFMFSAFQTLNAEGQALWILYCVPHSLASVLWKKAALWAAVTAVYPLAMFAIAIEVAGGLSWQFVGAAAVVLCGVPIFAVIATALGVFGCNPLDQQVQRRIRATYLYLYMLIATLYAYAVYTDGVWQRAALMILTALLAIALWQKARDQLDYLLDPSASPPSRVSVSDGLIAALLFFVLQGLAGILQMALSRTIVPTGQMLWVAFCSAGAVTYALMRLVYWRARTTDVPRMLGEGLPSGLLQGAVGGFAVSLVGLAYLHAIRVLDLFPALRQPSQLTDPTLPWWLAGLAVLAAPLFEEFIFRGLIFGGLRRMFGFGASALASAAIFAVVHPLVSFIPVFVMGAAAALVYERTRMLAAPIVLHAVYNAMIFAFQWSALGAH